MDKEYIIKWINNFENEKKKILFVYGECGTGKFSYINNKLKDNYKINSFTYIDFLYNKNILNTITHINNTNNVLCLILKNKKPIIIIKEVEFIKIKILKNILKEINIKKIKKNKNKINIPIILIGSGKCIKLKKDLEDICEIINFTTDTNIIKKEIMKKYTLKNNINNKIINLKNYNKINIILNIVSNNSSNEELNSILTNINYNTELYVNVKNILTKKISDKEILNYFQLEKILLPLLIHENYKKYIISNIKKKDITNCINKVAKNLMKSYIINEYIFNNHTWNLQELFAYLFCNHTSYIINNYSKKLNIKYPKLDYTKILTKNSVLFMNFKQYKIILHNINYLHNFDKTIIKYINKNIIIYLLYNPEIGYKYLKQYGFNKKDLLKLIKFSDECYFLNNTNDFKKNIEKNIKKL